MTDASFADELKAFRRQKDDFMRAAGSPLAPADRVGFTGLRYFEPNPAFVFELELDRNVDPAPLKLETSDGQQRTYRRAGRIAFIVDGQAASLTVFEDEHGYFLPFRDGTSAHESYPAGRYLEPERTASGKLRVDFNDAYNPYCAYSERYSCPLPPTENWLTVPIRAGEQRFHA